VLWQLQRWRVHLALDVYIRTLSHNHSDKRRGPVQAGAFKVATDRRRLSLRHSLTRVPQLPSFEWQPVQLVAARTHREVRSVTMHAIASFLPPATTAAQVTANPPARTNINNHTNASEHLQRPFDSVSNVHFGRAFA
jgi:hypothetical protein